MLDGKEDKKEFSGSGPHQDIRERHNEIEKKRGKNPEKERKHEENKKDICTADDSGNGDGA